MTVVRHEAALEASNDEKVLNPTCDLSEAVLRGCSSSDLDDTAVPWNVDCGTYGLGDNPGVGPSGLDESKESKGTEIVIVEVYDTMTLILTLPSDVMTRRSVLLGVLLVNVVSEESPGLGG